MLDQKKIWKATTEGVSDGSQGLMKWESRFHERMADDSTSDASTTADEGDGAADGYRKDDTCGLFLKIYIYWRNLFCILLWYHQSDMPGTITFYIV